MLRRIHSQRRPSRHVAVSFARRSRMLRNPKKSWDFVILVWKCRIQSDEHFLRLPLDRRLSDPVDRRLSDPRAAPRRAQHPLFQVWARGFRGFQRSHTWKLGGAADAQSSGLMHKPTPFSSLYTLHSEGWKPQPSAPGGHLFFKMEAIQSL